jgi:hypothetical protein
VRASDITDDSMSPMSIDNCGLIEVRGPRALIIAD